jgi:dihydroorotase
VALAELVEPAVLSLPTLVLRLTACPAKIAHLPAGTLAPGAPADVVVFDPAAAWTVVPASFFSKSRNTPFAGRQLRGVVRWTLVGGAIVHRAGDVAPGR